MPSFRVTLTYAEAESLLWEPDHRGPKPDPVTKLRARGKLIGRLMADRDYEPPARRAALDQLAVSMRAALDPLAATKDI